MSDLRSKTIKLAGSMSTGNPVRKRLLDALSKTAGWEPPRRIVLEVAKAITKLLITDAEIPLEVRQKAKWYRDLAPEWIREKYLDEYLWDIASEYVYQTDDVDEQGELAGNVEGEVNEILLREGIIGRRAR